MYWEGHTNEYSEFSISIIAILYFLSSLAIAIVHRIGFQISFQFLNICLGYSRFHLHSLSSLFSWVHQLELLADSTIHIVFNVSQLKKFLNHSVATAVPLPLFYLKLLSTKEPEITMVLIIWTCNDSSSTLLFEVAGQVSKFSNFHPWGQGCAHGEGIDTVDANGQLWHFAAFLALFAFPFHVHLAYISHLNVHLHYMFISFSFVIHVCIPWCNRTL